MIILSLCFLNLVIKSKGKSTVARTTVNRITSECPLPHCPNIRADFHIARMWADFHIAQIWADLVISEVKPAEIGDHVTCTMRLSIPTLEPVTFSLVSEDSNIAYPINKNVTFLQDEATLPKVIYLFANRVGETFINVTRSDSNQTALNGKTYKIKVIVVHSLKVRLVNIIIGWIYFVAWSISWYPMVFENFKRKSVIGLNFDFLCYNISGYIVYSIYCSTMFWIKSVQGEYFEKFGGFVIPIQTNDVFFAIHGLVLTIIAIAQCFIYEKGTQSVSRVAKVLVAIMWLFAAGLLIPIALSKINWMEYLTRFSYIKVAVTLIKYTPQAYMNYKRKSTVGWSAGMIHLDLIGGLFSMLQVFLLSYNNNQWSAIFGNFTKFVLGLVTIIFDVLFLFQHYLFYRQGKMKTSRTADTITMHDQVFQQEVNDE